MTTSTAIRPSTDQDTKLRVGAAIMAVGGLGFIGYAVIFLIRNFSDSFLELGIGPNEVDVGNNQIEKFSPSLHDYIGHLHIAVSGFIAAVSAEARCGHGSLRSPHPCSPWRSRSPRTTRTISTPSAISG